MRVRFQKIKNNKLNKNNKMSVEQENKKNERKESSGEKSLGEEGFPLNFDTDVKIETEKGNITFVPLRNFYPEVNETKNPLPPVFKHALSEKRKYYSKF